MFVMTVKRGIPPLVTHQPPSSLDDAPVIRGRMVQIPRLDYPAVRRIIYHARLVWRRAVASPGTAANAALAGGSCGASAVNRCRRGRAKDAAAGGKASAPAAPEVDSDTLPPLRYSAHVYASRPEKRSIVLNGKAWTEGDSPPAEPGGGADPAGCDDLQPQRHDLYPRGAGGTGRAEKLTRSRKRNKSAHNNRRAEDISLGSLRKLAINGAS